MAWGWSTYVPSLREDQTQFQASQTNKESWGKNVPKCIASAETPEDSPCSLHEAGPEDQAKIHRASEFWEDSELTHKAAFLPPATQLLPVPCLP